MSEQGKITEPESDDGLSADEIREMNHIARTPIAELKLECGHWPVGDAEIDALLAEAFGDDRDCVPPEDLRWIKRQALRALFDTQHDQEFPTGLYGANVRSALKEYFQKCADEHFRRLSGHVENLGRKLRGIRLSEPPERVRSPEEEVAAHQGDFHHLNLQWRGAESDALIAVLERGEKITKVMNDKIVTDKREIDRYSLREIRPPSIQLPRFIEQWERQFPARDEIERAVRSEEAD